MSEKDPYEDRKKSERTMSGERDTERKAAMGEDEDETGGEESEEGTQ